MLTILAQERLSFDFAAPGVEALKHAVNHGELKVGDLIRKDIGDGSRLWKIVAIEDGKCYMQEPTIWDEAFADVVSWCSPRLPA